MEEFDYADIETIRRFPDPDGGENWELLKVGDRYWYLYFILRPTYDEYEGFESYVIEQCTQYGSRLSNARCGYGYTQEEAIDDLLYWANTRAGRYKV